MPEPDFSLPKSSLFLTDTRLMKKTKTGEVVAELDITRFQSVSMVEEIDGAGVVITVGAFGLTFVCYRFVPDGVWRWLSVILFGLGSLACLMGLKRKLLRIKTPTEKLEYPLLDLTEDCESFVAMLNQRRTQGS